MKLATYSADGQTRTGIVVGDRIIDTGVKGTMIDLIRDWDALKVGLEAKAKAGGGVPLNSVKLEAPVQRPGKIFAIGLNYADHIEESKMQKPERQVWFTKAQTSVNGPYDPIEIAKTTFTADYEVELVAIVGKGGKHVSATNAASAIFGYCVGNDVTERMWQHAGPQWSLGKSFDTHAPFGPWIVTADEVGDPYNLEMVARVNGEEWGRGNTRDMHWTFEDCIAHVSRGETVHAGEFFGSGTVGNGCGLEHLRFLQPGDVVELEVERLGVLRNRVLKGKVNQGDSR